MKKKDLNPDPKRERGPRKVARSIGLGMRRRAVIQRMSRPRRGR